MCVIIHKPAGVDISDATLKTCWEGNSDGAGFAYRVNNEVKIKKGFLKYDDFLHHFKKLYKVEEEFLIHFRIRSSGLIDRESCHPFWVINNVVVAHNGTLSKFGTATKLDTLDFTEKILRPLFARYPDIIEYPQFQQMLEEYIGWSRLAFMLPDKVVIINKDKGSTVEGCWFSNTYHTISRFPPKAPSNDSRFPDNHSAEIQWYDSWEELIAAGAKRRC